MIRLMNSRRGNDSPLLISISVTITIYLGLALCAVVGTTPPNWVWLSVLIFPVLGLFIHISVKRILVIRCFSITAFSSIVLVFSYLFWLIVTQNLEIIYRLLAGILITVTLAALAIGLYRTNQRRPYLANMPHGPSGTLDPKTGFVDPTVSPPALQRQREQADRSTRLLLRWAPLAAGLSMVFVRSLSASGITITILIIAFVVATGGAAAVGSLYYFFVASLRWEKKNGKQIQLRTR